MAYQFTIILVVLSLAFAFTFIGNVLLAIMIIKLKRQEERETFDRKRHFDVLFTSLALGDALGSCLNYPMLLHSYQLSFRETEISGYFCEIFGSSAVFYFSYIAVLAVAMNLHNIIGLSWPFQYFIYLRRKRSKIPFSCVVVSLFLALVSLALSSSSFPLFKLTPNKYFNITICVPDANNGSSAKYYYLLIGHLCFWVHFFVFITTMFLYVRMRTNGVGRFDGQLQSAGISSSKCLPDGARFQIAFKVLYLVFWTPFIVSMTIATCSSYQIHTEVLLTVCYLMFVPGLLGPFVYYVTHEDLRDVFNTTIRNLVSRNGCHEEREHIEEIELQN